MQKNGQIFVLNMGDPVRIADLAKNMIRLSGYEPEKEIKIKYIGLRPGEKLYEELLMNEEGMQTTENSRIFIGRQIAFDEKGIPGADKGTREGSGKRMSGHLLSGKENGTGIPVRRRKTGMTDLHVHILPGVDDGSPEFVHLP